MEKQKKIHTFIYYVIRNDRTLLFGVFPNLRGGGFLGLGKIGVQYSFYITLFVGILTLQPLNAHSHNTVNLRLVKK